MSAQDFRTYGREVIDWIAAYLETCESCPVQSPAKPGDILARLPVHPPRAGEPFEAMLRDVKNVILPGITHWQSPNFFGYFPANNSYPSILGELLSAGLGVQGMLWATSPACTELEMRVLDWCAEMLALPARFRFASLPPPAAEGRQQNALPLGEGRSPKATRRGDVRGSGAPVQYSRSPSRLTPLPKGEGEGDGGGVILDTASSATLCAMLAARERATSGESNRAGLRDARERLVAYASTQAHSSVEKAARISGLGAANLRLVEVDRNLAMRVDRLHELMERDRAAGMTPFFVCATVGTTSSNAIDPVRQIGTLLRETSALTPNPSPPGRGERVWLHVDAAMSGTAALCPEFRFIHDGLEFADSYCFNPHKWMLTNFDCDCFYVADRRSLVSALSILPEYLRNLATESGAVVDYRDWQIPLGRRFRALKLWFVIRHYGVEGLQAHVREHVRLAQAFAQWVKDDAGFELAAPAPLNLVCFRHRRGDAVNQGILDSINRSGKAFLTHTRLDDKLTLRLAIGGWRTTSRHVGQVWELIRASARVR